MAPSPRLAEADKGLRVGSPAIACATCASRSLSSWRSTPSLFMTRPVRGSSISSASEHPAMSMTSLPPSGSDSDSSQGHPARQRLDPPRGIDQRQSERERPLANAVRIRELPMADVNKFTYGEIPPPPKSHSPPG